MSWLLAIHALEQERFCGLKLAVLEHREPSPSRNILPPGWDQMAVCQRYAYPDPGAGTTRVVLVAGPPGAWHRVRPVLLEAGYLLRRAKAGPNAPCPPVCEDDLRGWFSELAAHMFEKHRDYFAAVGNRPERFVAGPLIAESIDFLLELEGVLSAPPAEPAQPAPAAPSGEPAAAAPAPPSGYLGRKDLADALGVHPTRRAAFYMELTRQRKSLGDDCWIENPNRRAHAPKFLYHPESPKLQALAAKYRTPA